MPEAHPTLTPLQQLRAALHSGARSPLAVLEEHLVQSNGNQARNTYLWQDVAWSRQRAASLPSLFPDACQRPPLYGLPISLKDCFDLEETVTTSGTRYYAQQPPAKEHSAVAARLLAQGAVLTGKTHLHPLAYGITGENRDYGDCVQPGRSDVLTGGSSSGGAASVLEGSAVAAIGTDTGGSIRVPAALCGLAGYRASIGVCRDLWRGGAHLAPSFDTIGWLWRDLADGPWLASALFDLPAPDLSSYPPPTIGMVGAEFLEDCEPEVLAGFESFQQECRSLGAQLVTVDVAFWHASMSIYAPIQASEAAGLHSGHYQEFEPSVAARLEWGASLSPEEVEARRREHAEFKKQMAALFRCVDWIALPAAPVTALAAGADHTKTRQRLLRYTTPFSLAGIPVVTVPTAQGPTAGAVQLGAALGGDARLLAWSAGLGSARSR